jgi:multiple sugar transport system substrate-binding protein
MAATMLAEFHATHPDIRVFYVPDPENELFAEKMLADMQAGSAPDVFQGNGVFFPTWAQKGYTLDLRPFVKADLDQATIDDWDPAQYRSFFAPDGRQFGVPKYHGALALYYNKDLFDALGVSPPSDSWNQDDYLRAMSRVTRTPADAAAGRWGSMLSIDWDRLQVHANAWGGNFVDSKDPTRSAMADPPSLRAMEWLRARMWDDRVMATVTDVQNLSLATAFADGRLAMVEDGSWSLKDILTNAKFRVGLAPMPAGPARRVTLATTDGFGIYAGTRHPEAAWELVKFLIGKEYGRAMARANLLQPARLSLVDEWSGYVRNEFPTAARDLDIGVFADGQRRGYSVTAEVFPAQMDEVTRLCSDAWELLFTLGKTRTNSLTEVATAIDRLQDQAGPTKSGWTEPGGAAG